MRVERRRVLRSGYLVALWAAGYGLGRLWVEALRADAAALVAGVRVNTWMALLALAVGGTLAWMGRAPRVVDVSNRGTDG